MLKTLFWVCWLFLYFIFHLPQYYKVKRLRREGKEAEAAKILDHQVPAWAKTLLRHIGTNLTIIGEENVPAADETVLFVSNHQSYVDIPVFFTDLGRPHALMAKRELGKVPFLGGWMHMLGCIFVERDDIRAAASALRKGEELLQSGKSLIVCPEGTRSASDEMGEFKGGSVKMAFKTGVRIVPVAIDGTYKILEGNHYRIQKADVRMIILPPIETAGLSKEEQKELPKKLENMIRTAKDTR